ncbi:MAG: hypothetical protein LC624_04435 [Halobacteriales archaeon]|nr:hypothetical protein [Halobacteriales archaeon]
MSAYTWADLRRSLVISAVVGTILVSINQGPRAFLAPPAEVVVLSRMLLNYVVPFSVASVSALLANRARAVPPAGLVKARS